MEIKIDQSKIIAEANNCQAVKDALLRLAPEAFKKKDYKDIKTFEDACEVLNIKPNLVFTYSDPKDEIAFKKLKIIIRAINEGWTPNWKDGDQKKWWPWFNLSSGFGFAYSDFVYAYSGTTVGSRLCFETKEKSDYCANQFLSLYKDFLN